MFLLILNRIISRMRKSLPPSSPHRPRVVPFVLLFYDLIIVSGVSAISDPFDETVEYESGEDVAEGNVLVPIMPLLADALIQFLMLIIPWSFLNEYTSTFQDESLVGHMALFVHLLGLATTAASATSGCAMSIDNIKAPLLPF